MIEETLIQYGAIGVFAIYLIYDRQVLLRTLTKSIDNNTQAMNEVRVSMEKCSLHNNK